MKRLDVFEAVIIERARQDAKFGTQNHPDTHPSASLSDALEAERLAKEMCSSGFANGSLSWSDILLEEVMESHTAGVQGNYAALESELIQVMAVCLAQLECIERRRK